jgi:hypothetical protein
MGMRDRLRSVGPLHRAYSSTRSAARVVTEATVWTAGSRQARLSTIQPEDLDRTIWIWPKAVTHTVSVVPRGRFVKGGDWDRASGPIDEVKPTTASTVHMMFTQGLDYRLTPQYDRMHRVVASYLDGRCEKPSALGAYWARSFEDVDLYFEELVQTFEYMRTYGYRTQEQLQGERPEIRSEAGDEIRILVDRSGSPILGKGGAHRLLMASILNIARVPAELVGVHQQWASRLVDSDSGRRAGRAAALRRLQAGIDGLSLGPSEATQVGRSTAAVHSGTDPLPGECQSPAPTEGAADPAGLAG